ncbi:MAG: LacI family DNA-binding transcriptional regulator [Chthonomonadales bacterium]
MGVTQKEIARRLNLSQSLVAGVLGNRPGIWVSQEKRDLILRTARELGYRPNAAARSLRSGKTHVVACVFLGSCGYQAVAEALADRLAVHGYDLLVRVVTDIGQQGDRVHRLLVPGVCDAVAIWGLEPDILAVGKILEAAGVPFVVKGRLERERPHWFQVDFDHEAMMDGALAWIASHGRRRVAYIGYDNGLVYTQRLREGFDAACREHIGAEADPAFIAEVPEGVEAACAAAERWLDASSGAAPDAIVIGAGPAAWLGVEVALVRRGRCIGTGPSDVVVTGIGSTTPLLYGQAVCYDGADLVLIAAAMVDALLVPMLSGRMPSSAVVRLVPPLRRRPSLDLPAGPSRAP